MPYRQGIGAFSNHKIKIQTLAAIAIILVLPALVTGADDYWTAISGNWSDTSPCPWSLGKKPTSSDNAWIQGGSTINITQTGEQCQDLDLGTSGAGSAASIQMTGGSLTVNEFGYVGYSGPGTFTQTGGTFSDLSAFSLAYLSGSSGTYNLGGTAQFSANLETIGNYGPGVFNQTGGTNTAGYVDIEPTGTYALGSGTLNINGGLNNQGVWDLSSSSAVVNISSAIVENFGTIISTNTGATLNVDSHSLLIVPKGINPANYFKNYSNSGIVHESGFPLNIPSDRSINGMGSIDDHVNCQGSLCAMINGFIELNNGLNIDDGGSVKLGTGGVTVNDTSSGISGGSLIAGQEYIGFFGTGVFTQTAGINQAYYVELGWGHTGTYTLRDTGQLSATYEHLGYAGSGNGVIAQDGGTNSVTYLYLGMAAHTGGTYYLNGGTLITKAIIQGPGSATFNFGGGTLQASGSFSTSMPMTLTGTGGDANINVWGVIQEHYSQSYTVTLSGALSGAGGLNKLGSGMLILGAANTYTGNTSVNAGILTLSSTGSIGSSPTIHVFAGATFDTSAKNSSGGFTLNAGQTLMGGGTVNGNIVAATGSHVVPGDSAGTLAISGSLTLSSGALLDFELASTAASDKISMSSYTLYLNGQDLSAFNFTPLSGFGVGTYTLIDAGAISGNLESNLTGAIGNYTGTLSISGNDLILTVAVPEPAAWSLLVVAGLAMFVRKGMRYRCPRRERLG